MKHLLLGFLPLGPEESQWSQEEKRGLSRRDRVGADGPGAPSVLTGMCCPVTLLTKPQGGGGGRVAVTPAENGHLLCPPMFLGTRQTSHCTRFIDTETAAGTQGGPSLRTAAGPLDPPLPRAVRATAAGWGSHQLTHDSDTPVHSVILKQEMPDCSTGQTLRRCFIHCVDRRVSMATGTRAFPFETGRLTAYIPQQNRAGRDHGLRGNHTSEAIEALNMGPTRDISHHHVFNFCIK